MTFSFSDDEALSRALGCQVATASSWKTMSKIRAFPCRFLPPPSPKNSEKYLNTTVTTRGAGDKLKQMQSKRHFRTILGQTRSSSVVPFALCSSFSHLCPRQPNEKNIRCFRDGVFDEFLDENLQPYDVNYFIKRDGVWHFDPTAWDSSAEGNGVDGFVIDSAAYIHKILRIAHMPRFADRVTQFTSPDGTKSIELLVSSVDGAPPGKGADGFVTLALKLSGLPFTFHPLLMFADEKDDVAAGVMEWWWKRLFASGIVSPGPGEERNEWTPVRVQLSGSVEGKGVGEEEKAGNRQGEEQEEEEEEEEEEEAAPVAVAAAAAVVGEGIVWVAGDERKDEEKDGSLQVWLAMAKTSDGAFSRYSKGVVGANGTFASPSCVSSGLGAKISPKNKKVCDFRATDAKDATKRKKLIQPSEMATRQRIIGAPGRYTKWDNGHRRKQFRFLPPKDNQAQLFLCQIDSRKSSNRKSKLSSRTSPTQRTSKSTNTSEPSHATTAPANSPSHLQKTLCWSFQKSCMG